MPEPITSVIQAIDTNLAGLRALRDAVETPELTQALDAAAARILGLEGRLIVTGLGKSGHIGRKLAATFASTGTPAYFLHPSEASHGDLGMILAGDAVLMLSWSGETRELTDTAAYCQRFAIPLILISGRGGSALSRAADISLVLPRAQEACPHNLAPTTSTLLQLAIGDALAVAVLQAKGFSETSFHQFHPGGKLGASLTRISEIMFTGDDLPLVQQSEPVIGVVAGLSARNHGIVGVLDGQGRLAGVVTDGDIRRYLESQSDKSMKHAMRETTAAEIMTREPISLDPGRLAARALNVMQTRGISAAFVLEEGKPAGLITVLQLLRAGVA